MVSLKPEYSHFVELTNGLLALSQQSTALEFGYQRLIAENIMLRLFYELDKCVEGIALKITRGGTYLDGTAPLLLAPKFQSMDAARRHIMQSQKKWYLEWTTLSKIQLNLKGIVDSSDHFLVTRSLYDSIYEDMRYVRNHVAHNSSSTRAKFSNLSARIFSDSRGINAGKFLISFKTAVPNHPASDRIVVQYIKWSKVFIKTLTKAPS